MQRKSQLVLTASFGLAALVAAPQAVRADGHLGTGAACNPKKGEASRINYTNTGKAENSSSSSATIYCPMDFTSNPFVHEPSAVQVFYQAKHPTTPLTCTAYSIYWWGGIATMDPQSDTNAEGTFDFESRTGYEAGASFFSVKCVLPPVSNGNRSAIVTWMHGTNPVL